MREKRERGEREPEKERETVQERGKREGRDRSVQERGERERREREG